MNEYIDNFPLLTEKDKFIQIMETSSNATGRFVVNNLDKRRNELYKYNNSLLLFNITRLSYEESGKCWGILRF